ncbi:protease inhibitor I42 family protein [Flavobacterium difficile]|uniref:Protease inhibitor I42 family protein n=1 Tax=Flavobacterium difficile TaxID=2709659 RepID=A0ABX0I8F3_9FLAO|nr:protease inhibitor I42 family protein [Flavobacterium difficile]NHM02488.1 protease inhibitor I42 family protein [Flavobacterium difficile]
MMRKKAILVLLILSFVIFFFKLPNGTFRMLHKQYKLYNKECYHINVGETFEINLNENGSTGFINCWLNQNAIDIVEEINSEYVSDNNDKLIPGAGGVLTIKFKGIKRVLIQ